VLKGPKKRRRPKRSAVVKTHAGYVWRASLVIATLLSAFTAHACDIPVYDYTLQNWQRDQYQVWYFYSDTEDPNDLPVNQYLGRAAQGPDADVNLAFGKVNASDLGLTADGSLAHRIWARHRSDDLPFHLVLTPRGAELLVGRMDLATAKAMVQSPKRKQLAKQLCQGKQGLLLLLLGPDKAENATAQSIVRQVVTEAKQRDYDVGLLELDRKDDKEQMFVEQLLHIEDDLKHLDHTMVFAVFGRGHVLAPYLARGITTENIAGLVEFMNGPCSCTIKTTSTGMDLLTDWSWQTHLPDRPELDERPIRLALFGVEETASSETGSRVSTPGANTPRRHREKAQTGKRSSREGTPLILPPVNKAEPAPAATAGTTPAQDTKPQKDEANLNGLACLSSRATAQSTQTPARGEPFAAVGTDAGLPSAGLPEESLQAEAGHSLAQLLSARLGVMLGAVTLAVLAGGFAIIWRRRER